jgi:hypothetical protein
MKKLISLIMLVAVVGIAVADVGPGRRMSRPMVNLQQSVDQPGLLGPWVRVVLRFFSPSYRLVEPRYSAARQIVPVPPVCGVSCLRIPVQGIAQ